MAAQDDDFWGPGIEQYSRNLDTRLARISDKVYSSSQPDDLPSLSILEQSMCNFDPRNRENDVPDLSFNHVVQIFRRFMVREGAGPVFHKYYGFLCIRHLIQTTCLEFLKEIGDLDTFLDTLDQTLNWSQLSRRIALRALQKACETTADATSLGALYHTFTRPSFHLDNARAHPQMVDSSFIVLMLWADRESLQRHCGDGLLPGFPLFLLTILNLLPITQEHCYQGSQRFLREMAIRNYLVGSNLDRPILQLVCMDILNNNTPIDWELDRDSYGNQEDSRRLAYAYSGLLYVCQQDALSARMIPLDFMGHVSQFVLSALRPSTWATPEELAHFLFISFEFLWLGFELRPQVTAVDQIRIRRYAAYLFSFTGKIEGARMTTNKSKRPFARMLGEIDILGLVGRTLLVMPHEEDEIHDPESWEMFIDSIYQVSKTVGYAMTYARERLLNAKTDWAKVSEQIDLNSILAISSRRGTQVALHNISEMRRVWDQIEVIFDNEDGLPRKCANPRCFSPAARTRLVGARHACKKCNAVSYCSYYCQCVHWELTTSESHRILCGQSTHGI
ncbi:hypothetical protein FS749_001285 [Ceratobasidium sp. UAMH 11750]|nr:hypothetical protein FS749_001285 [Ceratobasidium sp. UAMH 11750]